MKKTKLILMGFILILYTSSIYASTLLDPNSIGFNGQSRDGNYEELINSLYASNKTTTTIDNNLWVPWFKTSSSCQQTDLQNGSNCNSGQTIDFSHNCMVDDELSQVGIMVAMGKNQTRMEQFYNTVKMIKSNFGNIPSWRVYRNGDIIYPCETGINGNCDTASDATARIIIALYTASNNTYFTNQLQKQAYSDFAKQLSADFLFYEVEQTCRPSNLGYGQICFWLAGGSESKIAGLGSSDYTYTGYFPDAIIAMLQACSQTTNQTYCSAASNITLNYLQASNFEGASFTAPPGRSFKWTNLTTNPVAQCTNSCSPVQWDAYDAVRAIGICQANYYANLINYTLPGLQKYCTLWANNYMGDPSKAPLQYYPNGTNSASYQSGYFAQGLQSLFQAGANISLFQPTLDNALGHYSSITKTWDYSPCFGVYTQAFAVRSLGMGIGKDILSFPAINFIIAPSNNTKSKLQNGTLDITTTPGFADIYLNNSLKGTTDSFGKLLVQNLESNTYELKISKTGYVAYMQNINIDGNNQVINVVLNSQLMSGDLIVNSSPTFASVYLNGTFDNFTDATGLLYIPALDFGYYKIQVSKTGYFSNNTIININSSGNTTIFVNLVQNGTIINTLLYSCTAQGTNCVLKNDMTNGLCRTIQSSSSYGDITIEGCERSNNLVEVYLLSGPKKGSYTACLGKGCVSKSTTYSSFYIST